MQAGKWGPALWGLYVGKVTSDMAKEGACLKGRGGPRQFG